jgi:hypothetical protein
MLKRRDTAIQSNKSNDMVTMCHPRQELSKGRERGSTWGRTQIFSAGFQKGIFVGIQRYPGSA